MLRAGQSLAQGKMKSIFKFVRFAVVALFVLECCSAVFAQGEKTDLSGNKDTFRAGFTGAGAGGSKTAAEKPGGADGLGNPLLGGQRHPLYRLQPSDVVEIDFVVAPEFNQTLTIQPDGYIMLKDAGMVEVQGLDLPEFREVVQKAYRGYLHDPEVAVVLKDFERPYFIVGGQVGKPGKYELRSDTSLTQAIAIAGGFTDASKHSQVILFRRVSDEWTEAKIINVKKMMSSKDLREDPELQPGDMLFIPKNALSKIKPFLPTSSVGAFASPGVF